MKKIVIDYVYKNSYSAFSKAREDVNKIAQTHGFTPFLINTCTIKEQFETPQSRIVLFFYKLRKLFILFQSIISIKRKTLALLQYPLAPFGEKFTLFFCRCLRKKNCHLVILIHDIDHFRYNQVFGKTEAKILNSASELIVHTPQMLNLLIDNDVNQPYRLLWLFDYLTKDVPCKEQHCKRNCVAFAGKLSKSDFLEALKKVNFDIVRMHLYGNKPDDTADYPEWMEYMGRFSPENVSALTEEWGLTWDGNGIEALHGPLGNYLKYNSSHKVSLYIAAGIPVIVSKDSALAEYVEKNKLGITISSLLELDHVILNQNKEEFQLIRKSVMEKSEVLRNGGMLGSVLDAIVKDIEGKQ
jgi:hypothetical protein